MSDSPPDLAQLAQSIKDWGRELGFQQVGITDVDLGEHEAHLQRWLDAGYRVGSASLVGISHLGPVSRPTPAVLGSAVLSTFNTLHRGRREDRYPYFQPMNPWEASP